LQEVHAFTEIGQSLSSNIDAIEPRGGWLANDISRKRMSLPSEL
jgi:hypothetical protein